MDPPDDEDPFAYGSQEVGDESVTGIDEDADTERIGVEPRQTPEPEPTRAVDDRPILPIGLVITLVVGVLLVMFAIQNTQMVEVNYFNWRWDAPLILALTGAFVGAVILDEAIGLWVRQRRRKRREAREELERLRRRA